MRLKRTIIGCAVFSSFVAGIAVAPFVPHAMLSAHAAPVPMAPQVIDVAAMQYEDLPQRANSPMRSQVLFSSADGSIAVQAGTIGKHTHQQGEEVQYIIEGSGTMWVGNERKAFKPGMLIVIPRGTAHGGASAAYKALAIKLPLPVAGDAQFID